MVSSPTYLLSFSPEAFYFNKKISIFPYIQKKCKAAEHYNRWLLRRRNFTNIDMLKKTKNRMKIYGKKLFIYSKLYFTTLFPLFGDVFVLGCILYELRTEILLRLFWCFVVFLLLLLLPIQHDMIHD